MGGKERGGQEKREDWMGRKGRGKRNGKGREGRVKTCCTISNKLLPPMDKAEQEKKQRTMS